MSKTQGKVHSIISNLVLVKVEGPVSQNEICFIEQDGERLMAEVIKVERLPMYRYLKVPGD